MNERMNERYAPSSQPFWCFYAREISDMACVPSEQQSHSMHTLIRQTRKMRMSGTRIAYIVAPFGPTGIVYVQYIQWNKRRSEEHFT